MANPLQPKVIRFLKKREQTYTINIMSASLGGTGDTVACIKGLFYMFEIKYRYDKPSKLQKQKINEAIEAGGKAYFICSVDQLKNILDKNIQPIKYELGTEVNL